jgi:hypothetical protein
LLLVATNRYDSNFGNARLVWPSDLLAQQPLRVEVRSCVHVDISLGNAHGKRARFGDAQAIIRRARAGATSIMGKDFLPATAPKCPSGRAMGVLQMARWWNSAPDLPDVSKCFRGIAQGIHAGDARLLCMGLFSIF